jgi:TPR repeat protein
MPKNCPQCGHAAPRKSTLHASDGVLRVLFYNAYRCRACHFRFWGGNPQKPVLLIGVVGLALFVGWWIPKDQGATVTSSSSENSYSEVATRAARGDANAEQLMGLRYAEGNGVIKNEKEAARWFEKAARHGQAEAQYRYGLALLEGRGVAQDYKAAFYWIEQPAKRGHSYAQYSLGELYRYGTGTALDKAQAYLWFNLAAAQGVEKAAKARDSLVWQLKPEQLTAMQAAARHLSVGDKAAAEAASVAPQPAP